MKTRALALLALLMSMLLPGGAVPVSAQTNGAAQTNTPSPPVPPAVIDDIAATERGVVRVVVVAIVNGEVVGFGHGSGFAVTPNRIVTNAHVVEDAAEYPENVAIGVVPSEGSRSYAARLVAMDKRRDLAIVEIQQGRVPPISIFTGPVAPRQKVYALGYPGNVDLATAQNMDAFIHPRSPIASDGIVSASDTVNNTSVLVHDADIARGNSGGPLVDSCGRVLGVNSFISRADEGDSPFSFAVSVRELTAFLRQAGQPFTGAATACVTAEEAAARDAARTSEDQRRAADAAARAAAQREEANADRLAAMRLEAMDKRDNFMALSFLLFGLAILCGSASFMFEVQNKPRERRGAIIGGAVLAAGSLLLFLLRPSVADVHLETPAKASVGVGSAPTAASAPLYGQLSCVIDRSRGRITVSAGDDPSLSITESGCVNNRTQYVRGPDGTWARTLVPREDATVTRISYDPATRESVSRRYLLSLSDMEAIRRQQQASASPACTTDITVLDALAERERAIAAMLPARANEEIFSRCRPSAK